MTRQRDFKALVRERMTKTGERYTAARAQLLAQQTGAITSPTYPGVLDRYTSFGGVQSGTGPLTNVLRFSGITSPLTRQPYTETTINGLCGGPGFLYAVFEYKGIGPILSIALQSRSMPDVYLDNGLKRLGLRLETFESSSAVAARKTLDETLAAGSAPICVTDAASFPWFGLPKEYVGGGPHMVAIAGRDKDDYWIDDRTPTPRRAPAALLSTARGAYRKAKNRLIRINRIDGADPQHDAKKAMRDAIADTAKSYVEPAVPKSFWVNCGFSGLDKWRAMLTDRKDKKAWPTVFSDGSRAFAGLYRAYESIDFLSAPGAGRAFYADFLEDASQALTRPRLKQAAATYREAGVAWTTLVDTIANCSDRALREALEITGQRLEITDTADAADPKSCAELWQRRRALAAECKITADAALALYAEMAAIVGRIAEAERAAVDLMKE